MFNILLKYLSFDVKHCTEYHSYYVLHRAIGVLICSPIHAYWYRNSEMQCHFFRICLHYLMQMCSFPQLHTIKTHYEEVKLGLHTWAT